MALSMGTLATIEALLTSRNDHRWGELPVLVQVLGEVQAEKNTLLMQQRFQPAPPVGTALEGVAGPQGKVVPGPKEPSTPFNHVEVG